MQFENKFILFLIRSYAFSPTIVKTKVEYARKSAQDDMREATSSPFHLLLQLRVFGDYI